MQQTNIVAKTTARFIDPVFVKQDDYIKYKFININTEAPSSQVRTSIYEGAAETQI